MSIFNRFKFMFIASSGKQVASPVVGWSIRRVSYLSVDLCVCETIVAPNNVLYVVNSKQINQRFYWSFGPLFDEWCFYDQQWALQMWLGRSLCSCHLSSLSISLTPDQLELHIHLLITCKLTFSLYHNTRQQTRSESQNLLNEE